mmetsp:Transcript_20155/g.63283  ORF Transcript_20155/g.63283 Transcript_20155/m.63283 type:complete len:259 (+) Transcript_20155:777-1553(+)
MLDGAPAHPGLEARLYVLAPVGAHVRVVAAQVQEEGPVHGDVPAGHYGGVSGQVGLGPCEPVLPQSPSEAHRRQAVGRGKVQLVRRDGKRGGHGQTGAVFLDVGKQRLQPARGCLYVAVEEDQHVTGCPPRALHASTHRASAPLQPHELHLRQSLAVVLELPLQPLKVPDGVANLVQRAGVIDHDDLLEELRGGVVQHGVQGADERHHVFVVEGDDHACRRQRAGVGYRLAARRPEVMLYPVHAAGLADGGVEAIALV